MPSGITFLALVLLLIAARFYEQLPLRPLPCGLRTLTGIPCLACGGTRSLMAFSRGEFVEAVSFNPLMFFGVAWIFAWFAWTLWRIARGRSIRPGAPWSRLKVAVVVAVSIALAAANWAYLICYLPE